MANVGKNIKQIRIKKKMTQDDLADKLFVSRQTISNYETGRSNPDIEMLIKIAEVLETDVNILIFGIPTPPDKKQDYIKLIISLSITLLLSIGIGIYTPYAEKWMKDTFDYGLMFINIIFLHPLLLLSLGYCLMQAFRILFGAKPLTGKIFTIIHHIIIAFLVVYGIIVIPFCMDKLFTAGEMLRLSKLQTSYSSSQIKHFLPGAWEQLILQIYGFFAYFHSRFPSIYLFHGTFFLLGIGLWGTGRSKKEAAASSMDTPSAPGSDRSDSAG